MRCSCGAEGPEGAPCAGCGKLTPAFDVSGDPFARLGLPFAFAQDASEILTRYRERMRRVHPDLFPDLPEAARRRGLEAAAALNEALQLVLDPLRRAEYLLAQRGVPTSLPDAAFRVERAELEQALAELDAIDGREEREQIARSVAGRLEAGLSRLGQALDAGRVAGLGPEAARLRQLGELVARWSRGPA